MNCQTCKILTSMFKDEVCDNCGKILQQPKTKFERKYGHKST